MCRKQVEGRKVYSALRSLKALPNFGQGLRKFLHKEVGKEAKAAADLLDEGRPGEMTRDTLRDFSFVRSISHSFLLYFL